MGSGRQHVIVGLELLNFNPRSPHGERLLVSLDSLHKLIISILAPRMGSGIFRRQVVIPVNRFQSSLPAWGAACS